MKLVMNLKGFHAEKRAEDDLERRTTLEYPMYLYIQGIRQIGESRAIVPFSLKTVTHPEVASFNISGELLIEGSMEEIETLINPAGKQPPKVWKKIYQESVNILTVLANVIEVPFKGSDIEIPV